ncbi:hypothetical protein MBAV_003390 [Candidatus Magnetobacterium bavaricum]|uniref:Uncharacterized protein n=1 Tax=Candidatus Magnetobacterium bavaricum TaxID=29290 RepID=A0A0F3GUT5_9BACT|nr:hypothetical protein MBAV_003390 [Candidatus Magnetobacterium bavaricum]
MDGINVFSLAVHAITVTCLYPYTLDKYMPDITRLVKAWVHGYFGNRLPDAGGKDYQRYGRGMFGEYGKVDTVSLDRSAHWQRVATEYFQVSYSF